MLSYPIGQSGQLLCFTSDVLSHFRKHRQTRFFHREAGGQLFAILDGASIVVIEATGPRKSDYRTRRSYVPDRKAEKEEIAEQQHFQLHQLRDGFHLVSFGLGKAFVGYSQTFPSMSQQEDTYQYLAVPQRAHLWDST